MRQQLILFWYLYGYIKRGCLNLQQGQQRLVLRGRGGKLLRKQIIGLIWRSELMESDAVR
ncbi:unnamed protein product [Paramecium octaurelia]|uniref:Uncharacterized protein n=1 Tax=Paramecium octaurelia TaxID=43137 RepID=A0A8S1XLS8_PAROT|nr:unnamed protein product [Paramecium octaurelia]